MAQQNAQLKALCTVMRHSTGVIHNDLQQEIGTISDERNDIRDRYNTLLETAAGDYIQHHRELHWLKRAQRNEALKSQCYDTFKKGMFCEQRQAKDANGPRPIALYLPEKRVQGA